MDLNEIRDIIEADEGKFIIVENGEPVMVVVSFKDYKNNLKKKMNPREEIPEVKNKPKSFPKELEKDMLTLEDLPL